MNPTLKSFIIISAKNAVNAVLTNAGLMAMFSDVFNLHSWAGVLNLLKSTGLVILAREFLFWLPKVMKWSQLSNDEVTK